MHRLVPLLALAVVYLAPSPSTAQSDLPRVYTMYFTVDLPDIQTWIENHRQREAPLLDSLISEGRLDAYDLWVHDTGGEYNVRYNYVLPNWGAIGDFLDAFYTRIAPGATGAWLSMVREHDDEIWVINDRHIPDGASETSPVVYESSFHVDYGQQGPWAADFEAYGKPALERAMEDGLLRGWAELRHDTGGPRNVKYVYWLDSWDQVDDLLSALGATRQQLGMGAESTRSVRAHADDVWRSVTRSGN